MSCRCRAGGRRAVACRKSSSRRRSPSPTTAADDDGEDALDEAASAARPGAPRGSCALRAVRVSVVVVDHRTGAAGSGTSRVGGNRAGVVGGVERRGVARIGAGDAPRPAWPRPRPARPAAALGRVTAARLGHVGARTTVGAALRHRRRSDAVGPDHRRPARSRRRSSPRSRRRCRVHGVGRRAIGGRARRRPSPPSRSDAGSAGSAGSVCTGVGSAWSSARSIAPRISSWKPEEIRRNSSRYLPAWRAALGSLSGPSTIRAMTQDDEDLATTDVEHGPQSTGAAGCPK